MGPAFYSTDPLHHLCPAQHDDETGDSGEPSQDMAKAGFDQILRNPPRGVQTVRCNGIHVSVCVERRWSRSPTNLQALPFKGYSKVLPGVPDLSAGDVDGMNKAELLQALSARGFAADRKLLKAQLRGRLRNVIESARSQGAHVAEVVGTGDDAIERSGPAVPLLDLHESLGSTEGSSAPPHGLFSMLEGRKGVRQLPTASEALGVLGDLLELIAVDPGVKKPVAAVLCRVLGRLLGSDQEAAASLLKGIREANDDDDDDDDDAVATFDCTQESWISKKYYTACEAFDRKRRRKNFE